MRLVTIRRRVRRGRLGTGCALGVVALLVGLTAGCSVAGQAHPVASRSASAAALSATLAGDGDNPPASPRLPLDDFALTGAQSSELYYLSLLFMKTCMTGERFRYLPDLNPAEVAIGAKITAELDSRLWGITDLVAAREYGYHLPPWTNGPGVPQTVGGMSVAERQAYGQCRTRTLQELAADTLSQTSQLVAGLQEDSWNLAESSSGMRAAFARWSACMKTHGYSYPDPIQAAADARLANPKTGAPLAVTGPEIKTAVADIDCKRSTGLLGVAYSVEAAIQNRLIRQYASELAGIKAQVHAQAAELARLAARYGIPLA